MSKATQQKQLRHLWDGLKKHGYLLGFFSCLAGCTNHSPMVNWTSGIPGRTAQVEHVEHRYFASFEENSGELTTCERTALRDFLDTLPPLLHAGEIYFEIPPTAPGSASTLLDQRISFLAYEMGKMGIPLNRLKVREITPSHRGPGPAHSGGIGIVVQRYVAIPPACPDHSTPESNFRCAMTYNMALMASDARDLVGGRMSRGADGQYYSKAVEKYRQDEMKELKIERLK